MKTASLLRRRFLVNADLHLRLLMTSMTIYHFRKVSVRMLLSMLTGKRALVRKWLCQLLWRQHMEPWTRINVDYFNASGLHLMGWTKKSCSHESRNFHQTYVVHDDYFDDFLYCYHCIRSNELVTSYSPLIWQIGQTSCETHPQNLTTIHSH